MEIMNIEMGIVLILLNNKMGDLTICVLNEREEPLRGIKVKFEYIGRVLDGNRFIDTCEGWGGETYTNHKGDAYFKGCKDQGLIKIYLNNRFVERDHYRSGGTIKIIKGRRRE